MDDLDDLIHTALANRPAAARTKSREPLPPTATGRELFTDAANWERRRGIAMVHQESGTLLGNYTEYVHRTVPGARKLLREDGPLAVTATEFVSGSWWLGERQVEARKEWHERRSVVLDVALDFLRVYAPMVELCVHLSYGAIARVELAEATMFRCVEGEGLVMLPAETNVLECMGLDGKIALRRELGL